MRLFPAALAAIIPLAAFSGCRKSSDSVPAPKPDTTAVERAATGTDSAGILAYTIPCGRDSAIKLYDDTATGDADYVQHKRIDSVFSDSGVFLRRTYYEGGDWLFVSKRTCAQVQLFGAVSFNPSRTAFASVNEDLEAGFEANGVQIVPLRGSVAEAAVNDRMDGWGPRAGRWKDDSTFTADLEDQSGHRKTRTYALRGGHWTQGDEGVAGAAVSVDTLPYPEERPDSD